MLIQRKLFKKKQTLLKLKFLSRELKLLIHKSLLKNHYNHYEFRLSFTINLFFNDRSDYFKTLQKLYCPFTLSKKVPSKHYLYSRFYLNKKLNNLTFNNTYK